MKTNKLLTIALLWTLIISWTAFADNTAWTWNQNVIHTWTNQDIVNYKNQMKTLRSELKSATNHNQKYNIRNQMFELTKQIVAKYPRFIAWYTHKDFHFTERTELSWFRLEFKNQKKQLKDWIKLEKKSMWENKKQTMKSLKKSLNKSIKQKIREINKNTHKQIKEIISKIKTLKEQAKQTKDKTSKQEIWSKIKWLWGQIKNLRINALEQIKTLVPTEQQAKIQSVIDNMKSTYNDIQEKKETFKTNRKEQKIEIYAWISTTVKANIDTAIEKLNTKLNTLTEDKKTKLLTHIQNKINKIIQAHINDTKINNNWIHLKTELGILNYLKNKINTIIKNLNK